ncbi:MAG TPA: RNA methyltransferase [Nitrospira sp.]|nr:RNA methyltransferase [Nitrospira sp.]
MSSLATPLTRAQSTRIRELLREKRARNAEGAFIIEGAKPVYDLLQHHPTYVQSVVLAADYQRRETDQQRLIRESRKISSFSCSLRAFAAFSTLENPQGVLAVVTQPRWDERRILGQPKIFGLYGEELQDPANVGAIIRTAAALNVDALWLTPESADIYNPKVVRASAGAVLSLPIFIAEGVDRLTNKDLALFAAVPGGGNTVAMETIRKIPHRLVIGVGNESRGLSARTINAAACRFTIPLSRHVESLNVAATAAIALHYLRHLDTGTQAEREAAL